MTSVQILADVICDHFKLKSPWKESIMHSYTINVKHISCRHLKTDSNINIHIRSNQKVSGLML